MKPADVEKIKVDLWLARDLSFRIDKEIVVVPRFTKCYKPKYTNKIKKYLQWMEGHPIFRRKSDARAICIHLEGMLRYVWRDDVLTKKEYQIELEVENERKREFRNKAARVLGKKLKGNVGEG